LEVGVVMVLLGWSRFRNCKNLKVCADGVGYRGKSEILTTTLEEYAKVETDY